MSDKYDEILKEKPKYADPEPLISKKNKYFKISLLVGIILSLIVILISYIFYYNIVLASESIVLNNINKVVKKYNYIYSNIVPSYLDQNNYSIDSTISYNDRKYNYLYVKNGKEQSRTFSNEDRFITFYTVNSKNYIKTSNIPYYIEREESKKNLSDINTMKRSLELEPTAFIYSELFNGESTDLSKNYYNLDNVNKTVDDIRNNFNSYISKDKYIKKLYLLNKKLIVEVNLSLNTNDLNSILGDNSLEINDNLNVNITTKNDAITNEIDNVKVVINNETLNKRTVITYDNKSVTITDDKGTNKKIVFNKKSNYYDVKFYNNNILYSVLSLENGSNKYVYAYRVIDKLYSINLEVNKDNNDVKYKMETNINNQTNKFEVVSSYSKISTMKEKLNNVKKYEDVTIDIQEELNKTTEQILFGN